MVHTNLTQEQLDSIAARQKEQQPLFQKTAKRLADVTASIAVLSEAMAQYNEAQTQWLNHHWTGIPTFTAQHGRRQRDTIDDDNAKELYARTDAVLLAWRDLKTDMSLAIQRHSFGYSTIKLRSE